MIYFAQDQSSGLIKIGSTGGNPEDRVKALQTGCPGKLTLLLVQHGDSEQERDLHRLFASCHERGEWFKPLPKLLAFLLDSSWDDGRIEGFKSGWRGCCESEGLSPPCADGDLRRSPEKTASY